jgi:hypothetical protein
MCYNAMHHYAECDHYWSDHIVQCQTAIEQTQAAKAAAAAEGRDVNSVPKVCCIPASGHMRDLERQLDVQDTNKEGKCPACKGLSPPSSSGSQ